MALDVAAAPRGKTIVVGYNGTSRRVTAVVMRLKNDGRLDRSFSRDGRRRLRALDNSIATGAAVRRDGRIVIVGTARPLRPEVESHFVVYRITARGALDHRFSGDGRAFVTFQRPVGPPDNNSDAVAFAPGGKIVIAGTLGTVGSNDVGVARLTRTGQTDRTFSGDGRRRIRYRFGNGIATDLAVQRDGRVVVAVDAGGGSRHSSDFSVLRLTASGRPDRRFSRDGRAFVQFRSEPGFTSREQASSVLIQKDGRIVVAGTLQSVPGDWAPRFAVVRLKRNGRLDRSFSGDGKVSRDLGPGSPSTHDNHDMAEDAALQPNGKVVVVGYSVFNKGFAVARYRRNGSVDRGFGGRDGMLFVPFRNGSGYAEHVTVGRSGKVVILGKARGPAVARLYGR